VSSGKDIVVGDFNLQVDNPGDANASKFYALLESLCAIQHVKDATHLRGHTFDLVISRVSVGQ
jgi:hypothetical protein